MRLHPVDDGVARNPDERGVTAIPFWLSRNDTPIDATTGRPMTNRASLATELARRSTDDVARASERAPRDTYRMKSHGIFVEEKITMWGTDASSRRVVRTVDMGDDPLPPIPRGRASTPRSPKNASTSRVSSGRSASNVRPDSAAVDKIIRGTGYTGPITRQMRRLARDAMSHAASVARYVDGN